MALSSGERKARLPFGTQRVIARAEGVSESFVSSVLNARYFPTTARGLRKYRRVQVRLARAIGMRVDDVFPPVVALAETHEHAAA